MLATIRGFLPDWPEWALDVLLVMSALLLVTLVFSAVGSPVHDQSTEGKTTTTGEQAAERPPLRSSFDQFRRKYILVYLVIMLADWM